MSFNGYVLSSRRATGGSPQLSPETLWKLAERHPTAGRNALWIRKVTFQPRESEDRYQTPHLARLWRRIIETPVSGRTLSCVSRRLLCDSPRR